jgi:hypothetical protein
MVIDDSYYEKWLLMNKHHSYISINQIIHL